MRPSQTHPQAYRGILLAETLLGLPVALYDGLALMLDPVILTGQSIPVPDKLRPFRKRLTPQMRQIIDRKLMREW